ncbi:hypothetical protein AKO1_011691 [Acrasis kona]|uniref:Uncharacterized protein n=1 Tax=Acrasis kona TaxID=1008807 RepID=A0AAW2Z7E4_9EUKA
MNFETNMPNTYSVHMNPTHSTFKSFRLHNLRVAYMNVTWQGTTRVLHLTYTLPTNNNHHHDKESSSSHHHVLTQEDQAIKERLDSSKFHTSLLLDVHSLGISFIDNVHLVRSFGLEQEAYLPKELLYMYAQDFKIKMDQSHQSTFTDVVVKYLQIDNADENAPFPVLLSSNSKSIRENEPMIRFSMCQSNIHNQLNTSAEVIDHSSSLEAPNGSVLNGGSVAPSVTSIAASNATVLSSSTSSASLTEQLVEQRHLETDKSMQVVPYMYLKVNPSYLRFDFKFVENVYVVVNDLMNLNKQYKTLIQPMAESSSSLVTNQHMSDANAKLIQQDNERKLDDVLSAPLDKTTNNNATASVQPDQVMVNTTATTTAMGNVSKVITKTYYDHLDIGDVAIKLTFLFDRSELFAQKKTYQAFEGLGMTLANVDDAPLRMSGFKVEQEMLTADDLKSRLQHHYKRQGIIAAAKVVGSLSVLGNPVDTFHHIKRKVTSRRTNHNRHAENDEYLFKTVMVGAFKAASNSIGRGISYLTIDKNYIKYREDALASNPQEVIKEQQEMIQQQVIVQRDDMFFYDANKEANHQVVVETKNVGLFNNIRDYTSRTLESLTNQFSGAHHHQKEDHLRRVRYPRTYKENGAIVLYDKEGALVQHMLFAANNTITTRRELKYSMNRSHQERCVEYALADVGTSLILLTNFSLVGISLSTESQKWRIQLQDVIDVELLPNHVIAVSFKEDGSTLIRSLLTGDDIGRMTLLWNALIKCLKARQHVVVK